MTRSVNFGGVTQFKPGGVTRVRATNVAATDAGPNGVLHLIGEADGGEPGVTITMDDPSLAKEVFRSGPLADAIVLAFNSSNDERITGTPSRIVAYKTNASTQSSTHVPGDEALLSGAANAGATTTVIPVNFAMVADAQIGRFVKLTLATGAETRRITDNSTTTITVSTPFSAAATAADVVQILETQLIVTSLDYGAHTNQISFEIEPGVGEGVVLTLVHEDTEEQSPEIAGEAFLRIMYAGGPIVDTGTANTVTVSGITVDVGSAPTSNEYAGMVLEMEDGKRRLIASNTAADPTVIVLDAAHSFTTSELAAYATDLPTVTVRNVTAATVSVTGTAGVATGMTSSVSPIADNLNLTFSNIGPDLTLRGLVNYLNANTNYVAEIPDGVNPDTTLMSSFDFGTRATSVDCRFDEDILPDDKGSFRRDLQVVIDWINTYSELVSAERAEGGDGEGSELPLNTGGVSANVRDVALYLTGGERGASTNSSFQTGFDTLILTRGNHIVPLISYDLVDDGYGSTATVASVAAQLSAHCTNANGINKNEMGGYIGFEGTFDELLEQARALNYTDIIVTPDKYTVLDVDGNLVEQPAWSSAVVAAAMRAGAEVGTPLTYKFTKTTAISHDTSWDSADRTDQNLLLQGGVMFTEDTGTGFRWVRDLTTHIKNDKSVFTSGSVRDAVRYIAYELRTALENEFTGEKGTLANVSAIKTFTARKLKEFKELDILVSSLDPETQTTLIEDGFRNLTVFLNGDVATVRVEIFPVHEIAFQLNDINLQVPILSA